MLVRIAPLRPDLVFLRATLLLFVAFHQTSHVFVEASSTTTVEIHHKVTSIFDVDVAKDGNGTSDGTETTPACEYDGGEIVLSNPMSVQQDDKYYVLGSQMLKAAHITIDAINLYPRCGVKLGADNKRYALSLRTYGDQSDAGKTAAIGNVIVRDNITAFMLAGYSSSLTSHLAPIAQESKRLLMTAGASRTSVHANRSHVFGVLPPGGSYLEYAIKGTSSKGASTIATINEDGLLTCDGAPDLARKYGMEFLNATVIPERATYHVFEEVAAHMKRLNPDVVINCVRTDLPSWTQAMRKVNWSPKAQIYTIVAGTPVRLAAGDNKSFSCPIPLPSELVAQILRCAYVSDYLNLPDRSLKRL